MKLLSPIELETSESVDINLSPLIDMVFLLLIFFMVTTVFVRHSGLDIDTPAAATAETLADNAMLLSVGRTGSIQYEGQEISPNAVRGLVARVMRHQRVPVIILADETVDTGIVIRLIDQCKLAGARTVSIAAEVDTDHGW